MAIDNSKKISVPDGFLRGFSVQETARKFLWQAYAGGRIASAYLFVGPAGVGKFLAALEFVKFLKCPNKKDGSSCENCQSCRTINNWDNPDVFIIFPMPKSVWESENRARAYEDFKKSPHLRPSFEKSSSILLSMIHDVQRFLSTPATGFGGKFVLVADAHKMNKEAANAFLKTLEEPPPDTHIILSTDRAEALLPTIRSRSQIVRFRRLSTEEVVRQLVDGYNFPPERADVVASISEGSIARALLTSSDEFQKVRNDALKLLSDAAKGDIISVWEWASAQKSRMDYTRPFLNSLISITRDVAVLSSSNGNILNKDFEGELVSIARRIGSPFDAVDMLSNLLSLQSDLDRNPQYALFYNAVIDVVANSLKL